LDSYLGSARPLDIIGNRPDLVLAAANDGMIGIQRG
jgi:hypothetical protein